MKNRVVMVFAVAVHFFSLAGCEQKAKPRANEMIDVTATVVGPDGKPFSKSLVVVLQPLGDTLGAKLEAKVDGKFSGQAAPGKYVYYVKLPNSEAQPRGVSQKFSEPNAENSVEVKAGEELTIRVN